MSIRTRLLNRAFDLLYGPLVFFHEPAGRCLFGLSWRGRRIALLDLQAHEGLLLDLGCGSGDLIFEAQRRSIQCVGVDPSTRMLSRAQANDLPLILARAQLLPLRTASVEAVVCSYPGFWIRDSKVWQELGRTTVDGGSVTILFGGTVARGRGSWLRSRLTALVYGRSPESSPQFEPPTGSDTLFRGSLESTEDQWGTVFIWKGYRLKS
jgi:SAM-dependent methyltransferase